MKDKQNLIFKGILHDYDKKEEKKEDVSDCLEKKVNNYLDDKLNKNGINASSASKNTKRNFMAMIDGMKGTCSCGKEGQWGEKCKECGEYF